MRSTEPADNTPASDDLQARIAELETRLAEKNLEADALREVGQAIGSMLNIDEMLKQVAEIVAKVTDTDLCLIYLLDEAGKETRAARREQQADECRWQDSHEGRRGRQGWVAQNRTPAVIHRESPGSTSASNRIPGIDEDLYESMLSVPLRGRGGLMGVVNIRTNEPHEYTENQISLLDSIARQVGGAVENYNQLRRMEQRATQLSALSEISRTITSDLYLEEILQLIVAMTAETMNFRVCSIMMLDADKQALVIKATQSQARDSAKKPNIKLADTVAGRAVTEGKPIIVLDVRKTPEYQYPDIARTEGLCSLIALPLTVKKEIIGVLNCYTGTPQRFSDEEINLLMALANQVALSIQNSKLMVQTAVLQEMHHRVKNSLQTIASLLRLQLRVGKFDSPHEALNQSINRIQSIAQVHEMLSGESLDDVAVRKLAENILSASARGLLPDARRVHTEVRGDDFLLPSGQATYVALILNELIQNAFEHGLGGEAGTELIVNISRDEDSVTIDVTNDGAPLAADFDLHESRNLGLKIVESLVRDNLMGEFSITTDNGRTHSLVRFPR